LVPNFSQARGKEANRGPAYHQRLLPAHTTLKVRHEDPTKGKNYVAALLEAEAAHRTIKKRALEAQVQEADAKGDEEASGKAKRKLEAYKDDEDYESDPDEDPEVKKRRHVLMKYKELDSDGSSSSESESDDE